MNNENKPENHRKYAEVATSYSDAMSFKKLILKKDKVSMEKKDDKKGS